MVEEAILRDSFKLTSSTISISLHHQLMLPLESL